MQTPFVLLIAIAVGILAKRRKRSPFGWGLLAAVLFVVLDTALAWIVLFRLFRGLNFNESAFIAVGLLFKLIVCGVVFFLFKANLLDERIEFGSRNHEKDIPTNDTHLVSCPQCNRKVIPLANGSCPSCMMALPAQPTE